MAKFTWNLTSGKQSTGKWNASKLLFLVRFSSHCQGTEKRSPVVLSTSPQVAILSGWTGRAEGEGYSLFKSNWLAVFLPKYSNFSWLNASLFALCSRDSFQRHWMVVFVWLVINFHQLMIYFFPWGAGHSEVKIPRNIFFSVRKRYISYALACLR